VDLGVDFDGAEGLGGGFLHRATRRSWRPGWEGASDVKAATSSSMPLSLVNRPTKPVTFALSGMPTLRGSSAPASRHAGVSWRWMWSTLAQARGRLCRIM